MQLPWGLPLAAKAHGEGGRHAVGALHLADLIQDGELFPVGVPEGAGLPNQEVMVPLIPQQDGPGGLQPLHQAVVDLRADGRALPLLQAPDQVLVVVHLQNAHHRAGGVEPVGDAGILRHVHPVGGGQERILVPSAYQVAIHEILFLPHRNGLGGQMVPIQQPLGLEGGHQGGEFGLKEMVRVPGQVEEALVAPDDVVGVRAENHNGQGGGDHGPPGGGIHPAGHVVQVDHDLLLPPGDARLEVEVEDQHQHQFCQAQPAVVAGREPGKQQAGHKEKAEACLCHFGERFLKRLLTHSNTTCTRCPKCNEGKNTIVMIHYTIAHPKNPEEKPLTPPNRAPTWGRFFRNGAVIFFAAGTTHW